MNAIKRCKKMIRQPNIARAAFEHWHRCPLAAKVLRRNCSCQTATTFHAQEEQRLLAQRHMIVEYLSQGEIQEVREENQVIGWNRKNRLEV